MTSTVTKERPDVTADSQVDIGTPEQGMPPLTDVHDAVYHVAHAYPGGVPALALRMQMNAHTLQKKVHPGVDTHQLNVGEFIALQVFADRYDPLYSLSAALGHEPPLRMRQSPPPGNWDLPVDVNLVHRQLAHIGAESGDVHRQVYAALQKKTISPNQRRLIRKEVAEVMAALNGLMAVL